MTWFRTVKVMNAANWRIFQVKWQFWNNSSNWLGFVLKFFFYKTLIHFDFLLTGWWYQHWLVPTHVVDFYWRRPKILYCCTRAIQGIMIIITIIETTCQVQEHITVGLGLSSIKAEKLSAKRNVSASNVRRILTLVSHVSPFFS